MAIGKGQKAILAALVEAMNEGTVAIVEVRDSKTGEMCDAICAVIFDANNEAHMAPLAFMVRENPYERFSPPMEGDERAAGGKKPIGFIH